MAGCWVAREREGKRGKGLRRRRHEGSEVVKLDVLRKPSQARVRMIVGGGVGVGGVRVRIVDKGASGSTSAGKVLIVPSSMSELLLIAGRKLGIRALQVFLNDGCEIEDITEVTISSVLRMPFFFFLIYFFWLAWIDSSG